MNLENTINQNRKIEPVLLDKAIQAMQDRLLAKLPWLNNAFGRAYKLVSHETDGNKYVYPAAYIGNSEYISLVPNDNFGNFSWFDIYDPQRVSTVVLGTPKLTFSGALVFWVNLDSIFPNSDFIYAEEVKNDILQTVTTPGFIPGARINITNIYERFENIYKGYSLEKIYNEYVYTGDDSIQAMDKQFFMHPYTAFRIEFELTTQELCRNYTE